MKSACGRAWVSLNPIPPALPPLAHSCSPACALVHASFCSGALPRVSFQLPLILGCFPCRSLLCPVCPHTNRTRRPGPLADRVGRSAGPSPLIEMSRRLGEEGWRIWSGGLNPGRDEAGVKCGRRWLGGIRLSPTPAQRAAFESQTSNGGRVAKRPVSVGRD